MRKDIKNGVLALSILALAACGGSSSSSSNSSSSSSVQVTSLSSIPEIKTMFSSSSSSSSVSRGLMRSLVLGTPVGLSEINSENVDELFWNGLIAEVTADESVANEDGVREQFWDGMNQCRMAQDVGYAMQNISQAGTSLCYMKNVPTVPEAIQLVAGSALEADELVSQASATKTVKINVSDPESNEESSQNQIIFIRVYGSVSDTGRDGYAADLWFCTPGVNTVESVEQIRVNSSTGAMTQTSVQNREGVLTNVFSAQLLENNGSYEFDSSQARVAQFFYSDDFGSFKSSISVLDDVMTNKNYNSYSFTDGDGNTYNSVGKSFVVSQVGSNDLQDILFYQGGMKGLYSSGDFSDEMLMGTEYQSSRYVSNSEGDYYDIASDYDIAGDSYYSNLEADSSLTALLENYSCDTSADTEINLDMSNEAMAPVQEECESIWNNMDFCRSDNISIVEPIFYGSPE